MCLGTSPHGTDSPTITITFTITITGLSTITASHATIHARGMNAAATDG